MVDISRLFKKLFGRRGTARKTEVGPLEDLVKEVITQVKVETPREPPFAEKVAPIEETPPKPMYGEALRRHMGWPEWFYDSQAELQKLGVKGEAQIEGARLHTPKQIRDIYARLTSLLKFDTPSFVRTLPHIFSYRNHYLDEYLQKLAIVVNLIGKKFSYNLPLEFDWRRYSQLYSSNEALNILETRLIAAQSNETENDKLRRGLEVYARKKILVIGARTVNQRTTIGNYLSDSNVTFIMGDDHRGFPLQKISDFDIVVITGGTASHTLTKLVNSQLHEDYSQRLIYAIPGVNPIRVLTVMAQNSHRFG